MSKLQQLGERCTHFHEMTIAIINLLVWSIAILIQCFVHEARPVAYAVVISGAIGAMALQSIPARKKFIAGLCGIISTILAIFFYINITGFRAGAESGNIKTDTETIIILTLGYSIMAFLIYVVRSIEELINRRK
jgi:zinc transporter ZupT